MSKISLIIPVYNALDYFKKCIKSVLKYYDFSIGEVLIVNDCSNSATSKYLKSLVKKHKNLRLINNKENLGWLKTCNYAEKEVSGEIVVFLNSDTEICSGFCDKIIDCFNSDEQIVTASPIASNSGVYFIPSLLPFDLVRKNILKNKPKYPEILNAEGFCLCVRKSYIDENGLFDEIYGMGYCEEVDFCLKAKLTNNKKSVLIDNLYVKHKRHASFKKKRNELQSKNNKILYARYGNTIGAFYSERKNVVLLNSIIKNCFNKFERFVLYRNLRFFSSIIHNNRIINLIKNLKFVKISKTLKNRVVYTCITGKCDVIPLLQKYKDENSDYVCFTDNKFLLNLKKIGEWNIKKLEFNKLDDVKNARWHKTHPHILFPQYKEAIWIDGNVNILTNFLFETINKSAKELLIPAHYCRNCIYDEANQVIEADKDSKKNVKNLIDFLNNQGFPKNYGLNETNIIYSKLDNKNVAQIFENWWEIIEKFSRRDQLSLSYVLWKNNVKPADISIPNARHDSLNYKLFSHV